MDSYGFRVFISVAGNVPCFVLLTVVPAYAYLVGDIKFPHILVSDVAAAGPLYSALYTFGFVYPVYAMSNTWTEWMRFMKVKAPTLAPAMDRFLFLFHGFWCPCLLLLSAFHFEQETETPVVVADAGVEPTWLDTLPKSRVGFVAWMVHVVAATVFFTAGAGCFYLLRMRITPHLYANGLMDPKDYSWINFASCGFLVGFLMCVVFRFLQIFHSCYLWAWPMTLTEVGLILLGNTANSMGTLRMLAKLDSTDPVIEMANVVPSFFSKKRQ